jgi:hypothetical protein
MTESGSSQADKAKAVRLAISANAVSSLAGSIVLAVVLSTNIFDTRVIAAAVQLSFEGELAQATVVEVKREGVRYFKGGRSTPYYRPVFRFGPQGGAATVTAPGATTIVREADYPIGSVHDVVYARSALNVVEPVDSGRLWEQGWMALLLMLFAVLGLAGTGLVGHVILRRRLAEAEAPAR